MVKVGRVVVVMMMLADTITAHIVADTIVKKLHEKCKSAVVSIATPIGVLFVIEPYVSEPVFCSKIKNKQQPK